MPKHVHVYHEVPGSYNPNTGRGEMICACGHVILNQVINFDAVKISELKKWSTIHSMVRDNSVLAPYEPRIAKR